MNTNQIWKETLDILKPQSTRATFGRVYQGTRLVDANGTYTIETPDVLTKEWLENRLKNPVAAALSQVVGETVEPAQLVFIVPKVELSEIATDEREIIVEDETGGFYVAYNEFFRRGYAARFKPFVCAIYHALCYHVNTAKGKAWPYQQTLADETGMSLRKAKWCIKLLAEQHIISIGSRRNKNGKLSNVYTLLNPAKWRPLE